MNADEIIQYIVKIDYNKPNDGLYSGSGVIVTLDGENSYFYIFSAKHTFFNKDFELNEKIDIQIKLSNPANSFTQELYNVEVVWCKKDYDFIVFKLTIDDLNQIQLPLPLPIAIHLSNEDNFGECIIYGYPAIMQETQYQQDKIEGTYNGINEKYLFRVHSNENIGQIFQKYNTTTAIEGLSGAGVFVSSNHIVGIQIQGDNRNNLLCFDLRAIIDEVNNHLTKNYSLKPIKYEDFTLNETKFDISNIDFNELKERLKNENITKIRENENHFNFLSDTNNGYLKEIQKQEIKLKAEMKKMADTYIYHGIIFHQNDYKAKATRNFHKAIAISQFTKTYFAKILLERKETTIENKKKLQYIQKSNEIIKKDDLRNVINIESKNINSKNTIMEIEALIANLDPEEDKEEILNLRFEIAKLFINDKNEILKEIEILFNSIASNSNKRDDFVKKIDEIQKDKDTIIDLNAHLHNIKEEFDKKVISSKEEISEIVNLLQKTVNQETLTKSLNSIDEKIGEIQKPVIPKAIEDIPNAIEALSNEMKDMKETSNNAMNQQFDKIDKTSDDIKGVISDNSNDILSDMDAKYNQQTILTIGLLFVLSILVFVLVFILIFFTD